jgi:TRAP-type C4-dicarboxylate transport system permease small subunit
VQIGPGICALDRALQRLYLACGYAAAGFLVLMALLVLGGIVSRLLSVYVAGLSEYAGYSMAASSFLALAYTLCSGGHIRVAIALSRLTGRAHRALTVWCLTAAAAVSGYLAYYAVRMTHVSRLLGERSEGSDAVPLWIPQLGMAAGSVLLALAVLHSLVKVLLGAGDQTVTGPHGPDGA